MELKTLFIDLDDTLYPASTGLWAAIRRRMDQYMLERMGFTEAEIPLLRADYFHTYGTTLRGLQIHHQVDPADFLAYVHDLPLEEFLAPQPGLREMLVSLPHPRWIFTNADRNHANRVLKILDLDGIFKGIIDIWALEFACKPTPLAYQRAMLLAGASDASQCVLVDDSLVNLDGARRAGFTTFWINSEPVQEPDGHICLAGLQDISQAMPELWKEARGGPAAN